MDEQSPDKKPAGKLQRLVSDARKGQAEAPQSELNAAKPEPKAPEPKRQASG